MKHINSTNHDTKKNINTRNLTPFRRPLDRRSDRLRAAQVPIDRRRSYKITFWSRLSGPLAGLFLGLLGGGSGSRQKKKRSDSNWCKALKWFPPCGFALLFCEVLFLCSFSEPSLLVTCWIVLVAFSMTFGEPRLLCFKLLSWRVCFFFSLSHLLRVETSWFPLHDKLSTWSLSGLIRWGMEAPASDRLLICESITFNPSRLRNGRWSNSTVVELFLLNSQVKNTLQSLMPAKFRG